MNFNKPIYSVLYSVGFWSNSENLDGTAALKIKDSNGNWTQMTNLLSFQLNARGQGLPSLVLYDKKVNIDQMRVLYNSMTQPVTYVQGPPGTGKTQTILNVILCGFVANKTMLITSANNTPIDGIIKKLNFKYYDKDVIFPYLRLGIFDETIKAAKRILELYDYYEKRKPNETLINHILNLNDSKNEALRMVHGFKSKRIIISS